MKQGTPFTLIPSGDDVDRTLDMLPPVMVDPGALAALGLGGEADRAEIARAIERKLEMANG
jgi:hypothetical protein